MLTLTQLAQLRDSTITYAERAAVWREACEIRTTQADAEQVVFFLQGTHDNNIVLTTAAREINKYLDQTASVIEYKNRAIASLEDSIDELRGKIKGKDEGLARLQGEIVTLQAEITGLRYDITEHEERSDITEHEARSAVEIKGLKQQLTVAKEALSKEQATNADLRSMSDGLSTLVAKLRADHAQAALESLKGENQKLRVAFNLEQLKLTDIQGQRDTLAAQMDATTDLIHRMRSDHAQALSERQQLRIAAKQTEAKLGDLQRRYKEVEDAFDIVRAEKEQLREALRLQEKLNSAEALDRQQLSILKEENTKLKEENTKARTDISVGGAESQQQRFAIQRLEHRVSDLLTQLNKAEAANTDLKNANTSTINKLKDENTVLRTQLLNLQGDASPAQTVTELKISNDKLHLELSGVKYARDQLKKDRVAMAREYEAVLKENRELRQSKDELPIKQQLAEVRGDLELHAITQALPLFAGLDVLSSSRVLRYLTDRLVTDRIVDEGRKA